MKQDFGNIVLSSWGGVNVESKIDETEKQVKKMIKLTDHGDDFLIVKTNDDRIYEYGYFLNRHFGPSSYIRKPELFRNIDAMSSISNKIYHEVKNEHGFYDSWKYKIVIDSESIANYKLELFAHFMQGMYKTGVMYHVNDYKEIIINYLKANNVYTDKNEEIVNSIIFDTSYYGIDGIAGKIDISGCKTIGGDNVTYVYIDGKSINPRHYKRFRAGSDEWGVDSYFWKV